MQCDPDLPLKSEGPDHEANNHVHNRFKAMCNYLCIQREMSAHTHTKIDAVMAMPKSIIKHAMRYIMCMTFL